jgi:hypothetical protein
MLQSQSVYCAVLPYSSVHSCVHEVKRERMVIVAAMAFSMEVLIASMAFSVMLPVALALVLTWCGYHPSMHQTRTQKMWTPCFSPASATVTEYHDKLGSGEDEDLDMLKSVRENWEAIRGREDTRPAGKGVASSSSHGRLQQLRAALAAGAPHHNTMLEPFDSELSASNARSA